MTEEEGIRRENLLREALELMAGAMETLVKVQRLSERDSFTFTGDWAHLGTVSVKDMLERSNKVLGETKP